jgi:hypothetical protein
MSHIMTWREGVTYWREWARKGGDISRDEALTISMFYDMMMNARANLDDEMPPELVQQLGMSKNEDDHHDSV